MKEKLAMDLAGESTTRIVAMDGTTAEDVINKRKTEKFNDMVDAYTEKFEKHSANIQEFADKINNNVNKVEIMPLQTYILVKEFEENPFQRIVRDTKSGIIIDTGGLNPQYKNTDNGQIEEEEQFIKVGVVQEVGPECKYLQPGDAVFYPKNASIPVPFYKQKLIQINETRVLAVVSEGLTERFNNIKKNK
jgi:co-chaperonin GroES (HSP10)